MDSKKDVALSHIIVDNQYLNVQVRCLMSSIPGKTGKECV